jgi:hypothetical protein
MRVLALGTMILAAAVSGVDAQPQSLAEIPFEYRDGLIWLRVSIPDFAEPLSFLLDSGAAVSAIDRQTARRLQVKLGEPVTVRGVSSQTVGHWTPTLSIRVADMGLTQRFLAVDLQQLSRACDRHIDGLLGADFFCGRVVQIDYQMQTVRLLPDSPAAARGQALPIRVRRGAMCVPVSVDGSRPQWVRLDTGCAKPLHWVTAETPISEDQRQISIGLAEVAVPVRASAVRIGAEQFEAVTTGLHRRQIFAGEAGLLGNGLLSQFKITVDRRTGHLLLEKY